MTDFLKEQLLRAGLTKQQASSVTAETMAQVLMSDDCKMLLKEAQEQVREMKQIVCDLKREYYLTMEKINAMSNTLLAIQEAQNQYCEINDEKARTVLALYSAILGMNQRAGADSVDSVKNAGYIAYAYLGGQAKRDITYSFEEHCMP